MKKKNIVTIIAYAALILVCVIIVYAVPSIQGLLVDTYITEPDELTLSDKVEAYFVRDEKVYKSKVDGKLERLAKPDKLYKAGTKIVNLTDENGIVQTEGCFSKKAGYVVYSYDGYEKKIKSSKINKIKKATYEQTDNISSAPCGRKQVASGGAMYKVVKNGKWFLTFYIDTKAVKKYNEGSTVYIKTDDENIKAEVYSVTKGKQTSRVILQCGIIFDGCLIDRHRDVEIIVANATGLKIENRSIIKKGGKRGVLVKNKMGQYIFKPICIKATDGENSIVYQDIYMDEKANFVETLGIYDEIIAEPSKKDVEKAK